MAQLPGRAAGISNAMQMSILLQRAKHLGGDSSCNNNYHINRKANVLQTMFFNQFQYMNIVVFVLIFKSKFFSPAQLTASQHRIQIIFRFRTVIFWMICISRSRWVMHAYEYLHQNSIRLSMATIVGPHKIDWPLRNMKFKLDLKKHVWIAFSALSFIYHLPDCLGLLFDRPGYPSNIMYYLQKI